MEKIIIAAIAKNGIIGWSDGRMPWHSKTEFKHFKDTTLGFPVIMGRKTFDTLGKPLKGRLNIIITRNQELSSNFDDVKIVSGLNEAYNLCNELKFEKIFVIGGGEIYRQSMNTCDRMILSYMNFEAEGDVFFPEIEEDLWKQESSEDRGEFIIKYFRKKSDVVNKN